MNVFDVVKVGTIDLFLLSFPIHNRFLTLKGDYYYS